MPQHDFHDDDWEEEEDDDDEEEEEEARAATAAPALEARRGEAADSGSSELVQSAAADATATWSWPLPVVAAWPSATEWLPQPLCWPYERTVTLANVGATPLELRSAAVAGGNAQFWVAGFEPRSLPVGERAAVNVAFLPRVLGNAEATLVVQSSAGDILLPLRGTGVVSPYGVAPLSRLSVPVASRFSHHLVLHNPYAKGLHLLEAHLPEDHFKLDLLRPGDVASATSNNDAVGPLGLWQIAPGETRAVLVVEFVAPAPGHYHSMLHIELGRNLHCHNWTHSLLIPIDIEACMVNVKVVPDVLDFGTLLGRSPSKRLPLRLLNVGSTPIAVEEVFQDAGSNSSLEVLAMERGGVLQPDVEATVADVLFRPLGDVEVVHGTLFVRTNDTSGSSLVVVRCTGRVLRGEVTVQPPEQAVFFASRAPFVAAGAEQERLLDDDGGAAAEWLPQQMPSSRPKAQSFRLRNGFQLPLALLSAHIVPPAFQLLSFPAGSQVGPGALSRPVRVQYRPDDPTALPAVAAMSAILSVFTDLGKLEVELQVHSGHLELGGPQLLDLGCVGAGESRTVTFTLRNPAPRAVPLLSVSHSMPVMSLHVIDVRGPDGTALPEHSLHLPVFGQTPSELQEGHTAVFALEVRAGKAEDGAARGAVAVRTLFEQLIVAVTFELVDGVLSLSPSPVHFQPSFPGRMETVRLCALSTFPRPILLQAVLSSDPRLLVGLTATKLDPGKETEIATLTLDLSLGRHSDYVLAGSPRAAACANMSGTQLDGSRPCLAGDKSAMQQRDTAWQELLQSNGTEVVAQVFLQTDVVSQSAVPVLFSLVRPHVLANESMPGRLEYGQVHVHTTEWQDVWVENPSDWPLQARLALSGESAALARCFCAEDEHDMLLANGQSCTNLERRGGTKRPSSSLATPPAFVLSPHGVNRAILPPRSRLQMGPVGFLPRRLCSATASLVVHNNLTLQEQLQLRGEGAWAHPMVQGLRTYQTSRRRNVSALLLPLKIEGAVVDDQALPLAAADCKAVETSSSFIVENVGTMPLVVHRIGLDKGFACARSGLSIKPCDGFTLGAQEMVAIEVRFKPDFSEALVERHLFLESTAGVSKFLLLGQLPQELQPLLIAQRLRPQGALQVAAAGTLLLVLLVVLRPVLGRPRKPSCLQGVSPALNVPAAYSHLPLPSCSPSSSSSSATYDSLATPPPPSSPSAPNLSPSCISSTSTSPSLRKTSKGQAGQAPNDGVSVSAPQVAASAQLARDEAFERGQTPTAAQGRAASPSGVTSAGSTSSSSSSGKSSSLTLELTREQDFSLGARSPGRQPQPGTAVMPTVAATTGSGASRKKRRQPLKAVGVEGASPPSPASADMASPMPASSQQVAGKVKLLQPPELSVARSTQLDKTIQSATRLESQGQRPTWAPSGAAAVVLPSTPRKRLSGHKVEESSSDSPMDNHGWRLRSCDSAPTTPMGGSPAAGPRMAPLPLLPAVRGPMQPAARLPTVAPGPGRLSSREAASSNLHLDAGTPLIVASPKDAAQEASYQDLVQRHRVEELKQQAESGEVQAGELEGAREIAGDLSQFDGAQRCNEEATNLYSLWGSPFDGARLASLPLDNTFARRNPVKSLPLERACIGYPRTPAAAPSFTQYGFMSECQGLHKGQTSPTLTPASDPVFCPKTSLGQPSSLMWEPFPDRAVLVGPWNEQALRPPALDSAAHVVLGSGRELGLLAPGTPVTEPSVARPGSPLPRKPSSLPGGSASLLPVQAALWQSYRQPVSGAPASGPASPSQMLEFTNPRYNGVANGYHNPNLFPPFDQR
eukprot:SM000008S22302  [mRNA]  locus=s8:971068:977536:- [translate_table: standard]